MKSLPVITILFLSLYGSAQDINKCYGKMIFVKAEQMPAFGRSVDSLKSFFATHLSSTDLEYATGTVTLEIIICTNGKAVLDTFFNKTDIPVSDKSLKNLISTMPAWNSAIQNGRMVDCIVNLELTLKQGILAGLVYKNNSQ